MTAQQISNGIMGMAPILWGKYRVILVVLVCLQVVKVNSVPFCCLIRSHAPSHFHCERLEFDVGWTGCYWVFPFSYPEKQMRPAVFGKLLVLNASQMADCDNRWSEKLQPLTAHP